MEGISAVVAVVVGILAFIAVCFWAAADTENEKKVVWTLFCAAIGLFVSGYFSDSELLKTVALCAAGLFALWYIYRLFLLLVIHRSRPLGLGYSGDHFVAQFCSWNPAQQTLTNNLLYVLTVALLTYLLGSGFKFIESVFIFESQEDFWIYCYSLAFILSLFIVHEFSCRSAGKLHQNRLEKALDWHFRFATDSNKVIEEIDKAISEINAIAIRKNYFLKVEKKPNAKVAKSEHEKDALWLLELKSWSEKKKAKEEMLENISFWERRFKESILSGTKLQTFLDDLQKKISVLETKCSHERATMRTEHSSEPLFFFAEIGYEAGELVVCDENNWQERNMYKYKKFCQLYDLAQNLRDGLAS